MYKFLFILILFGSKFYILIISLKKIVCVVFYVYIFDLVLILISIANTNFLIYYLEREMVTNICFGWCLSDNSKHYRLLVLQWQLTRRQVKYRIFLFYRLLTGYTIFLFYRLLLSIETFWIYFCFFFNIFATRNHWIINNTF